MYNGSKKFTINGHCTFDCTTPTQYKLCLLMGTLYTCYTHKKKRKTRRDDENGRENVKKGSDVRKITVVCALLLHIYENKDIELFLSFYSPSSILALLLFSFHYVWRVALCQGFARKKEK